MIPVPGIT